MAIVLEKEGNTPSNVCWRTLPNFGGDTVMANLGIAILPLPILIKNVPRESDLRQLDEGSINRFKAVLIPKM
jgi:hypothetical protein